MKILFFSILFFVFSQNLCSHTYNRYLQEFFFDRLPSAKIEAMGKILSVGTESHFVSQSNPALLTQTETLSAFFSHSKPYYFAEDFQFYFSGLSYIEKSIGTFALNLTWLDLGETYFSNIDGYTKKVRTLR